MSRLSVSVFPDTFRTSELSPTYPVLLNIDEEVNIFMTYAKALELSRLLREACDVEEAPQVDPAA